MLHAIRKSIESSPELKARESVDFSRSIILDHSEGKTDGVLQLIFSKTSATPIWVAKAAPLERVRRRYGHPLYQLEFETLEQLERSGINRDQRRTPEPLGSWQQGSILVTLQSALPGALVKNVPGNRLFADDKARARIGSVFDWWEKLQACAGVRERTVDPAFYEQAALEPLARFCSRFRVDRQEHEFLDRRLRRERRLVGRELPMMVRHGDFCTANMSIDGERIAVFDWEFPLEHRLPLFDLFHFFASLRYPFVGRRGESKHFESFQAVFWGRNLMNEILRESLTRACRQYRIDPELLPDLFLLTLIEVANLKFEGLVERYGDAAADPGREFDSTWQRIGGRDKDAPASAIVDGVYRNTRFISRKGLPLLAASV